MEEIVIRELNKAIDERKSVALVILIKKEGSTPRESGSMMLVDGNGNLLSGTIGGGEVEERAKKDGAYCVKKGISNSFSYNLTLNEDENSIGMACGGNADIFVKVFSSGKSIWIFGAGHIGSVLAKMAKLLDYHVTVVDDRAEYGNKERFPDADRIINGEIDKILSDIVLDSEDNVVIVTHGHSNDLLVLRSIIERNVKYIGMIGSSNKVNYCFKELIAEGIDKALIERVHAPIGIDIGGNTPAEIALGILAEIQAVNSGKQIPFMKDSRKGTYL